MEILRNYGLFLVNDPLLLKSGQIEFLVPKDLQFSETYAKPIFRFSFNFFV